MNIKVNSEMAQGDRHICGLLAGDFGALSHCLTDRSVLSLLACYSTFLAVKHRLYLALADLTFEIIKLGLSNDSTVAHYAERAVLINYMARGIELIKTVRNYHVMS